MKNALYKSVALHLVVLILFLVDVPVFWRRNMTIEQVPIIVDLNNVKISEMTNLPPKAKRGPEEKQASKIKRKIEKNYTKDEPDKRPEVKSEPQKDAEETPPAKQERVEKPKQDFLVAPQPKKPKAPVKKTVLMIRDSFGLALMPYLDKTFAKNVFAHNRYNKRHELDRLVAEYKPDIMIEEMVERYFDRLLKYNELYGE